MVLQAMPFLYKFPKRCVQLYQTVSQDRKDMIKLIPEQYRKELSLAISNGEFEVVKKIIEHNNIDVDSFEEKFYSPLIMNVLTSFGYKNVKDKLTMLHYFLEKGANPNVNCKAGYNSLLIAVQQESLIKALDLFLDYGGDVNSTDKNGCSVVYWAIQSFPWRKEGEERQIHLDVIEKIFLLGADLDLPNKFGVTPRKWLEHTSEDVKELASQCENLKPIYRPSETVQPNFPTNFKFPETVEFIRKNLIPLKGEAETLEGEMLRGLDILSDEAHRNGNVNYSTAHKKFAEFILENLTTFQKETKEDIEKITIAVKKLMKPKSPYLEDDVFDYLTDQICIFYNKNKNDIKEEKKKWWKIWE